MITISFHNDGTGTDTIGNYDVTVSVNGVVVDRARVEGHDRSKCWRAMVARLLVPEDSVFVGSRRDLVEGMGAMVWTPWTEMWDDDA